MYDILTNILAFAFALGVIIFVHELGHLVVAKLFGIRAHVFSLGFGRRVWGFERGGTDYRVSALPLGGYVRLGGEDPAEVTGDPAEFLSRPRWQRIVVYLAGPAMNVVLAIALIAVVFMAGVPVQLVPDIPPVVGSVVPGGPAASAGLSAGDKIVDVDGKRVSDWADIRFSILTSPGRPVALRYEHRGVPHEAVVTPEKKQSSDGTDIGDAGVFPVILPRISDVVVGGPAERAGVKNGDQLRTVDHLPASDIEKFVAYVQAHGGVPIELGLLRDGKPVTVEVTPNNVDGKGRIGVHLGYVQRYGPWGAVVA
ncbi:MAG TPA: RIP metalloprotease RseP, partial [Thermoanaerobaculia bacterium]|nr:RIP metalloprotease RseP [Thermoanaerobaculia bacterium]